MKLQLNLKCPKANHSLGTIAEGIKSMAESVERVEFKTLDGACIPENELLRHRNNIPFVMSLKMRGGKVPLRYAINLNQSFSISNKNEKKVGEEKYLEYCLGIGLPQRNSFFLANFASKLHHTLP